MKNGNRIVAAVLVAVAWVVAVCVVAPPPVTAAASTPSILPSSVGEIVRAAPTWVDARVLSADTAETVTVKTFTTPASAINTLVILVFSATCGDYYVSVTGTAAVPSDDVTDGTASEHNPAAYKFSQGDTFSILAPTTCKVTFAYHLSRY